jgi:hypothetical protein
MTLLLDSQTTLFSPDGNGLNSRPITLFFELHLAVFGESQYSDQTNKRLKEERRLTR